MGSFTGVGSRMSSFLTFLAVHQSFNFDASLAQIFLLWVAHDIFGLAWLTGVKRLPLFLLLRRALLPDLSERVEERYGLVIGSDNEQQRGPQIVILTDETKC